MTAADCPFCDNGVLYGPGDRLSACRVCNPPADGERERSVPGPVGLRELHSQLRGVEGVLRVAEKQAHGTRSQRLVAIENIRHARRTVNELLADLEMFGVPA